MVKEKVKKGTARIVRDTVEAPGGDCQTEKCQVAKPSITNGMTLVKYNDKTFHASCAIREGIKFTVPKVPKTKRVD